jgi:hypothetical protein
VISFLRSLFACRHGHISRVFTDRDTGRQYVVCMDCCGRYVYDWTRMKLGGRVEAPRPRRWNDGLETQV